MRSQTRPVRSHAGLSQIGLLRPTRLWPLLLALILTAATVLPSAFAATNTFHTGSGNFEAGQADAEAQMQVLKAAGADTCRVCVYQNEYGIGGPANPAALDATLVLCDKYGLKPVLLFENYGQTVGGYGTYDTWKATGAAFAARFGSRVLAYTAINEPDADGVGGTNLIGGPKIPPALYHDCLEGFSDGVKGVNSALFVAPGGFCKPNSMSDWTCEGYLSAIADLFNDHKLDGIDLHLYTNGMLSAGNSGPAPLDLSYTGGAAQFSAQNAFTACKVGCKITSDPAFLSTEFNYTSTLNPADGARGFLTAFFDLQGVVGDDGATRKTVAALVWQIQTLDAPRLKALSVAMGLQGATYTSLDPSLPTVRRTGMYVLSQGTSKIYVWQNRYCGWSTLVGPSITLSGIPMSATRIDVSDAAGLRPDLSITIPAVLVTRQKQLRAVTLTGLPVDQTLIFTAH